MAQENRENSFQDIKRIGKLSGDGVFIYNISDTKFLYLNSAIIRILEINKKLLMEDPALLLHFIPEEDQDYMQMQYRELLQKNRSRTCRLGSGKTRLKRCCPAIAFYALTGRLW